MNKHEHKAYIMRTSNKLVEDTGFKFRGVESETPTAPRGWGLGMGVSFPSWGGGAPPQEIFAKFTNSHIL